MSRTLKGPFDIEGSLITHYTSAYEEGSYVVIYYHLDSGFAGTCNECERMWWFI